MRVHSTEKINRIKDLRRNGNSINEIVKLLSLPKTTVWHHVHKLELTPEIELLLKSKRGGSALRSQNAWNKAEEMAIKILSGPKAFLSNSAAMLYWGEGGKKVCDLTNTDSKLIQLYLKFVYDVLGLTNENLKFTVRIFTGMNSDVCLNYWAHCLDISEDSIVLRYNDGGISGKAKYGICRVTIKKGSFYLKLILSLIRYSFSDIMGFQKPVEPWINFRRNKLINIMPP